MQPDFNDVVHIFFDLDHTLWDFDKNSRLAYQQIFEEEQLPIDIDKFIAIYEPLNLKFWRMYRHNEISKEELRFQRLKQAFDAVGFQTTREQIDRYADLYIEYLPNNNHLFSGCFEMLEALSTKYRLHIITNGFDEVQERKMNMSGLQNYFDVCLTAETAGIKKPAIEIFNQAMQLAGAIPSNSCMVGDSYEADILGGKNAGMHVIWFDPHSTIDGNDIVTISQLSQLTDLLL
jgi:putative hydrolase of the HAD superfamily